MSKVSLYKPVSLVKNPYKADARIRRFDTELRRLYRLALRRALANANV